MHVVKKALIDDHMRKLEPETKGAQKFIKSLRFKIVIANWSYPFDQLGAA